jgi:hypothetical protein
MLKDTGMATVFTPEPGTVALHATAGTPQRSPLARAEK